MEDLLYVLKLGQDAHKKLDIVNARSNYTRAISLLDQLFYGFVLLLWHYPFQRLNSEPVQRCGEPE